MGQFGAGQGLHRLEDERLLRGAGRYTDDIVLPGQVYGVLVRSPLAHARIGGRQGHARRSGGLHRR